MTSACDRIDPYHPSDAPSDESFDIESAEAYVASTAVRCGGCRHRTEVICLYCRAGTACGEPLECFTLHEIHGVDRALAQQLGRWPAFRLDERYGAYVNHCTHCNAVHADLHSEPHLPFYDIAGSSAVVLTRLHGTIRLNGDYSVDI